ncbi:MAG: DNA primase [Demequinaceae bacterium]|nr:DNA primase [Demequinaceae bacterium]
MAGSIVRDDIEAVREKTRIEDIVGERVALKSGGVGSLKGLCPFHDEKTPSFHVRPSIGRWHCFGCGEGGDVISFLMKADGLPFAEAVEYLAGRVGISLRYESGGKRAGSGDGSGRRRLVDANRVAAEFYVAALESPEAKPGRDFLTGRGFDKQAAETFGIGYAPKGWTGLVEHLRNKGFTEPEIEASGLASRGQQASGRDARLFDRFRGRLVWPIRAVTGEVVGFGARRLYEDDDGPKYLNTPETPLYKKSQVLYGLDLAKKAIASSRRVVVVEGYTDVMACHLAGVPTAVATCGTAFGEEHARMLRRLLGGQTAAPTKVGMSRAEVVFTFDADEAGQNAALKAFQLESEFLSQTFVAIGPDGLDPCDLRLQRGDKSVEELIDSRVPLFEFVIKAALAGNDLESAEGRVAALRAAAPVVAQIRDEALRPEYARRLAGWLGVEVDRVRSAVMSAGKAMVKGSAGRPGGPSRPGPDTTSAPPSSPEVPALNPKDPVVRAERLALEVLLQAPASVDAAWAAALEAEAFTVPQYRAVWDGIVAAGGIAAAGGLGGAWVNRVADEVGTAVAPVVSELAVSPMSQDRPAEMPRYARSVLAGVRDLALTRRIAEARGRMQRIGEGNVGYQEAFAELVRLEGERRALREE